MSSLIFNLDAMMKKQLGENGHTEYEWSSKIREQMVQFYYQLNRAHDFYKMAQLKQIYTNLLKEVFSSSTMLPAVKFELLIILYKMIAHTRDIIAGKGEYKISYMLISVWASPATFCEKKFHEYSICLAKYALRSFVDSESSEHPLGSWKDIKYFLNYWRSEYLKNDDTMLVTTEDTAMKHPIVAAAVYMINNKLREDVAILNDPSGDKTKLSLVAKWIPREKSKKFGWLTKYLAIEYFKADDWFKTTCNTEVKQVKAIAKVLTNYRKEVSRVNKVLETVQINQCGGKWQVIDFSKKVTSITMAKQKNAFLNKKKDNQARYPTNEDRVKCAENYNQYISDCAEGKETIKGKRVSMYDFVKDALHARTLSKDDGHRKTIDLQWKNNSLQTDVLKNMIAMVDVSGSMESDNCIPLYNAIGLGIRIAEKSSLGKRVMTFSSKPSWVSLDGCTDFVDTVSKLRQAEWGTNTNFYAAFDLIVEAYLSMDMEPDEVDDVTLVILSDMQIDQADNNSLTMFENMQKKFADAGLRSRFNKPYKLPTIVFWNLRSTNGFPVTSTTNNTIMVSGSNPSLLNGILVNGIAGFMEINPWNSMVSAINHERYKGFENVFNENFSVFQL